MPLLVTNIPWSEESDPRPPVADRLGLSPDALSEVLLLKRSVDGRRRPPVWLANYRVVLSSSADEDCA